MSSQLQNKKGLTVKDLIVMGVFAALLTVCSMIGGVFFAITPTLTFYFSIGAALLSGPVFLLLLAKVPKKGALSIIGTIISLLSLVLGMHWGMLDLLGLMPYQNRHPNTLSGGQKQRVAVAVSMICGKELLIFDEPTSGLDYDSMEQVAGLIRSLASNGKIIFVVTHDYEFVCRSCSRMLHFDNGTLEEDLLLSEQNEKKIHTIFGLKEEENYA